MFADDIRRALPGTPRAELCALAAVIWKGFAAGALSEGEAQQLAEEIEARKAVPVRPVEPRRCVGSRPRSPEVMERRRRWNGSGWLPPQLAARFTMAEGAVLAVIAAEVARRGLCRLTLGHVAALAGVSRSTAKAAVREAAALGLLTSEEWRITAWRNAPNTVRIVSPEWRAWLRMRDRRRALADHPRQTEGGRALAAPHVGGAVEIEARRREGGVGSNPRLPLKGVQILTKRSSQLRSSGRRSKKGEIIGRRVKP